MWPLLVFMQCVGMSVVNSLERAYMSTKGPTVPSSPVPIGAVNQALRDLSKISKTVRQRLNDKKGDEESESDDDEELLKSIERARAASKRARQSHASDLARNVIERSLQKKQERLASKSKNYRGGGGLDDSHENTVLESVEDRVASARGVHLNSSVRSSAAGSVRGGSARKKGGKESLDELENLIGRLHGLLTADESQGNITQSTVRESDAGDHIEDDNKHKKERDYIKADDGRRMALDALEDVYTSARTPSPQKKANTARARQEHPSTKESTLQARINALAKSVGESPLPDKRSQAPPPRLSDTYAKVALGVNSSRNESLSVTMDSNAAGTSGAQGGGAIGGYQVQTARMPTVRPYPPYPLPSERTAEETASHAYGVVMSMRKGSAKRGATVGNTSTARSERSPSPGLRYPLASDEVLSTMTFSRKQGGYQPDTRFAQNKPGSAGTRAGWAGGRSLSKPNPSMGILYNPRYEQQEKENSDEVDKCFDEDSIYHPHFRTLTDATRATGTTHGKRKNKAEPVVLKPCEGWDSVKSFFSRPDLH